MDKERRGIGATQHLIEVLIEGAECRAHAQFIQHGAQKQWVGCLRCGNDQLLKVRLHLAGEQILHVTVHHLTLLFGLEWRNAQHELFSLPTALFHRAERVTRQRAENDLNVFRPFLRPPPKLAVARGAELIDRIKQHDAPTPLR